MPSQASMHYSGCALGPVSKFAFDVGDFAIESSSMCMIDPYLVTARTQVFLFDPLSSALAFWMLCLLSVDRRK